MGVPRTASAVALALVALAAPAEAGPSLQRDFADCAGRFSAAVEHAWLMQDRDADGLDRDRHAFLSLIEALGAADDRRTMAARVEAKAAQATLLQDARFGTDPARKSWAARRADAALTTCRLLLLGG